MIDVQLSKQLSAMLEIGVYGVAVLLEGQAELEVGLELFVGLGYC